MLLDDMVVDRVSPRLRMMWLRYLLFLLFLLSLLSSEGISSLISVQEPFAHVNALWFYNKLIT